MKKIIYLVIVLAQLFSIPVSIAAKPTAKDKVVTKTNIEPKNKVQPKAKEQATQIPEPKKEEVQGVKKRPLLSRLKLSEQNPLRKIARGTVNTTLGWLEIPRQTIKVNKEKGDIAGAFWGPLKGFAFFVKRTAIGIYEVTTFLLPPYKSVIEPEFIFADEEDD
ncbi:MAG: exosortase system-associated protein, TIGR04073 family [Candidatus Omnitrophota bacterium]|nr:exosortase system-associated protein, TIGR04073 family [Candidatus Omnitrophota bacterium]